MSSAATTSASGGRPVGSSGVWVANQQQNLVTHLDPNGKIAAQIPMNVGFQPFSIAVDGNITWVVNSSNLVRVDATSNKPVSTTALPAGSGSGIYGVAALGAAIWVTNYDKNEAYLIGLSTGQRGSASSEESAVRAEPDRHAARRQRAERGREPAARRLDAAADRRHRPGAQRPGGEEAIVRDLGWLGVEWDDGPVRQSDRAERHREAAEPLGARFEGTTLIREDGSPTYHLASVVDDIDFGITHVVRGNDHRPNEELHRRLHVALGAEPPEYVHHGLILGDDGKKLAKRAEGATVASLREAGIPAEAVRRYLDQLGLPTHDVHYDLPRIRRYAIEAIGAMPDDDLAAAVDAPLELVPALRGARDLNEARTTVEAILTPSNTVLLGEEARPTLARFRELREGTGGRVVYARRSRSSAS